MEQADMPQEHKAPYRRRNYGRPKSKLNNAPSKVIEKEILQENPEMLALEQPVKVAREIPKTERIVFRNDRDPGFPLEFHFSSATHPLHHYKLLHGQEYELPVEVIEHLESRCIPIYVYRKGQDGRPERVIGSQKYMFQCKTVRQ